MTRKQLFVAGIGLLIAVFVVIFLVKKVHYVDPKPAIALGGEYFSKLKQGQIQEALAMYSDEFRNRGGENWQKFFVELNTRYGPLTGATLAETKTLPVADDPCVIVRYQVTRPALSSDERLTICPQKSTPPMAIAGHEIVRLDTDQRIAAGITAHEKEIFSIGAVKPTIESRVPDAARKATDEFYGRMSKGEYDAIYDASTDEFKASATKDKIADFLNKITHRTGGSCGTAALAKMTPAPSETGDILYLSYDRKCANGDVRDGTAWKLVNGKALLVSYFLNSPDSHQLPVIAAESQEDTSSLAQKAMRSAERFYENVSAKQYEAIPDLGTQRLKQPQNRRMFVELVKQVDERAGACGTPTLSETSYTTSNTGMFVELSYSRKCAKREISDRFTWKIVKGEALLDGYYVFGLTG